MRQFKKFSHIENGYQTEYVNLVKQTISEAIFVCQEKIHGTQSQLIIGRNDSGLVEVGFGKRSGELQDGENFYNWQYMLAAIQERAIKLFELLEKDYDVSHGVNAYGEFFGGGYTGVDPIKGMKKIQKGIQYCPGHEFYGFDIFIHGTGYLAPEKAMSYYEASGIFHAETLFKGTLDEYLKYPIVFPTTIPGRLGLPEVPDNFAEGVVIKPVEPAYFPNGERIIIKNKNPKFQEIGKSDRKLPKTEVIYSEEFTKIAEQIPSYVNENRLISVRSHLGETTLPKDFGKILKEYNQDIIQELIMENLDNRRIYEDLPKSEQRPINSIINKMCADNIKETYMSL